MSRSGRGITRKRTTLPRTLKSGGFSHLDGRRPEVRAVKLGVEAVVADRGGEESTGFLALRTAHRVNHLDQLLARDERDMAEGKTIDRAAYLAGCATWLRYAQALGLERRARPIRRLADVIAEHNEPTSSPPPEGTASDHSIGSERPQAPAAGNGDAS